ncbi:hypothetical protein Droror1_Dr00025708 [Drosera rotundifolia]
MAATARDSGCFTSQPREPSWQRHDQWMEDAWAVKQPKSPVVAATCCRALYEKGISLGQRIQGAIVEGGFERSGGQEEPIRELEKLRIQPVRCKLDSRWRRRRATSATSLLSRENRAGNDTTSGWKTPGLVRRRHDSQMTTMAQDESDDNGGNKNEGGGAVWIRISGTSYALMRKGNCELVSNKNDEHIGPR